MIFVKLSVFVMVYVVQASAIGKRSGSTAANYGSSSVNYGERGTSSARFEGVSSDNYGGDSKFTSRGVLTPTGYFGGHGQNEVPQPYNFDYQSVDQFGNTHYHREEADASGTISGSYGYTDILGLYRVFDYIADANGFRANIRTNEPGTDGRKSPADVQMTVEQPPFGIQDNYDPYGGAGRFQEPASGGYEMPNTYGCSAADCYVKLPVLEDKDTYA